MQPVTIAGKDCLEQSTVDYVLTPNVSENAMRSLSIVDNSYLRTDHRPLLACVQWDAAVASGRSRAKEVGHEVWSLREMTAAGWRDCSESCDMEMVGWLAEFQAAASSAQPHEQQSFANTSIVGFLTALSGAAHTCVGKKKVGKASKPFIDKEVRVLLRERKEAICGLRAVPPDVGHADEKLALIGVKERLRKIIRKKKAEAELRSFREIEGSEPSRLLWNRWQAHTNAVAGAGGLPTAALDSNGKLVTGTASVLRVWREFVERLGKADAIPDVGDRASGGRFDDDFARQVLLKLKERILDARGEVPELTRQIAWDELYAVLLCSSNGKATGHGRCAVRAAEAW